MKAKKLKTKPWRAIDYIRTQEGLDGFVAEITRSAYLAGQLAMRERCAEVALNQPLPAVTVATAIRSLEPEDVT